MRDTRKNIIYCFVTLIAVYVLLGVYAVLE
jgi:hypothetical protein